MTQQVGDTGINQFAYHLYAQCFTGQAKEGRAWCSHCHSLSHLSKACPLKPLPAKQPRHLILDLAAPPALAPSNRKTCQSFNKQKGCKFGQSCHRNHCCSGCGGPHPLTHCLSAPSNNPLGPVQSQQTNTLCVPLLKVASTAS